MESRIFLVAAPDPRDASWVTPVQVRCSKCGGVSPPFGGVHEDPRESGSAYLEDLGAWADGHLCGPSLSPDGWYHAANAVSAQLAKDGCPPQQDGNVYLRAAAAAVSSAWDEIRDLVRRELEEAGDADGS